jgi:hypothetical protein
MSKLGIKARIYRNTSGNYGSPSFSAIHKVSDLAVNPAWDMSDADSRESRIKNKAKTMLDLTITGKVKVSNSDAGYIALWEAAHNDDALDLLILNGPMNENGTRGYRGFFQVNKPAEDQGLDKVLYMGFELMPADNEDDTPIKLAVVAGGTPVFSDLAA